MKTISFIFFILFLVACSDQKNEQIPEKAITIKSMQVAYNPIAIPVYFSGVLQTEAEMRLSFKIGGIIKSIQAEEGKQVKKNQVLATLDLTEINAGLAQARAAYQKAERDAERVQNLYVDTVATLEQLQNSKTALEVAKANLRMTEFNQRHAQILAPDDGIVLKRFGEENELIGPGIPVFVFSGKQQAWIIKGGLSDRERIRVSAGDEAEITFDLYPGKSYKGEVLSVAGTLDPMSATYSAEIVLLEKPENVISGMIGKVKITPSRKQPGFQIPVSALGEADGMTASVFVINQENRVKKVKVKIAAISNDNVLINSGLKDGMQIATDGAAYLMNGSLIQVVNE